MIPYSGSVLAYCWTSFFPWSWFYILSCLSFFAMLHAFLDLCLASSFVLLSFWQFACFFLGHLPVSWIVFNLASYLMPFISFWPCSVLLSALASALPYVLFHTWKICFPVLYFILPVALSVFLYIVFYHYYFLWFLIMPFAFCNLSCVVFSDPSPFV